MGRKSRQKKIARAEVPPTTSSGPRSLAICAGLAILTLLVFAQVTQHQFLNYDDGQFVTENEHVSSGITADSLRWAFTSASIGWYPLTWLSHMLDVEMWGARGGMHAFTGVVLHILSTCILFLALRRMTEAPWPSAAVAALFAIHPMHVESVAWVSERKDTLSTLFAMLALLAYATAQRRRALWLFILMALSLMAKQMYVTLPFVLLLLDVWPMRRMRIAEKVPLFALSIAGSIAAVVGQSHLASIRTLPLTERLSNAAFAYVRYLGKLVVPVRLAVLYPLENVPASIGIASAILIIAISVAAILLRRRAPYAFVGWFWFVGTLVPVIGIVQIGPQAIADRYTYFPYIGLFIAIVWSAAALVPRKALVAIGIVVIATLAIVAYRQVRLWRDSETLFTHTLAVTRDNPLAEYLLGQSVEIADPDRAITHLQRAIALAARANLRRSWSAQAYVGLGTAILAKAQSMPPSAARTALIRDGLAQLQYALVLDPNAPHARNNIAVAESWLAGR